MSEDFRNQNEIRLDNIADIFPPNQTDEECEFYKGLRKQRVKIEQAKVLDYFRKTIQ